MTPGRKVSLLLLGCVGLIVAAVVLTPRAKLERTKRGPSRSWGAISGDLFADNMRLDNRTDALGRSDGLTLPTVAEWAEQPHKVEGTIHYISVTEEGFPVVWVSSGVSKKEDYFLGCEADEQRDTSALNVGDPIEVWGVGAPTGRYGHGNTMVREADGETHMEDWYTLVLEKCGW